MLNHPHELGMNLTRWQGKIIFICCLIWLDKTWLITFAPCSSKILAFIFFGSLFVHYWYQGYGDLTKCLWECSILFSILEMFEKDSTSSFGRGGVFWFFFFQNSPLKPSGSGLWSFFLNYYCLYFTSHDQSDEIIFSLLIWLLWTVYFQQFAPFSRWSNLLESKC